MSNITDIKANEPRKHSGDSLEAKLEDIGFRQDEFGIWRFRGWCDISLYQCLGGVEVDISTSDGALGCDTERVAVVRKNGGGAA